MGNRLPAILIAIGVVVALGVFAAGFGSPTLGGGAGGRGRPDGPVGGVSARPPRHSTRGVPLPAADGPSNAMTQGRTNCTLMNLLLPELPTFGSN